MDNIPRVLSAAAMRAIQNARGPLYDALVATVRRYNMYDLDHPREFSNRQSDDLDDEDDEIDFKQYCDDEHDDGTRQTDPHIMLRLKLSPPSVSHFFREGGVFNLPPRIRVGGAVTEIVIDDGPFVRDRRARVECFLNHYDGFAGYLQRRRQLRAQGRNTDDFEKEAVEWLLGGDNDFATTEGIVEYDMAAAESRANDNLDRLKQQFARDGGDPADFDELTSAFLEGDYQAARAKFTRKYPGADPQARGCGGTAAVILIAIAITAVTAISIAWGG